MSVFNWVALLWLIELPISHRFGALCFSYSSLICDSRTATSRRSKDAEWLINGVRSTDAE